jgi:hypothetical protein
MIMNKVYDERGGPPLSSAVTFVDLDHLEVALRALTFLHSGHISRDWIMGGIS